VLGSPRGGSGISRRQFFFFFYDCTGSLFAHGASREAVRTWLAIFWAARRGRCCRRLTIRNPSAGPVREDDTAGVRCSLEAAARC